MVPRNRSITPLVAYHGSDVQAQQYERVARKARHIGH
jgi:hypothetical protein